MLFGPPGELAPGYLADMGPMGVSILSEREHQVGSVIEVHFGVAEDQTSGKLQMRAVVRHCGHGKIGVHFIDVDATQREHWWTIMRGDL